MAKTHPSSTVAPPVEEALRSLYRQHVRAVVWLGVRLVAVAVLVAALEARVPAMRDRSLWVTLVAALLVIWPFYTAIGKTIAWRISLGSAYLREGRWDDAERTLGVLLHRRWQPFDALGEGLYGLAVALRQQGRSEESLRVLREVAQTRRGLWREKAEKDLVEFANAPSPNRSGNS